MPRADIIVQRRAKDITKRERKTRWDVTTDYSDVLRVESFPQCVGTECCPGVREARAGFGAGRWCRAGMARGREGGRM